MIESRNRCLLCSVSTQSLRRYNWFHFPSVLPLDSRKQMEEGRREEIGGASSVPITIRLSFIPYTTNDVDDIPLCFCLCAGICPSHPRGGGDSSAALPPQQFPLITDLCAADRPAYRRLMRGSQALCSPPPPAPGISIFSSGGRKRKRRGKEEGAGWFVRSNLSPPPYSSPCPALKLPRPSGARGDRMTIARSPAICLGVGMTARDNYANF